MDLLNEIGRTTAEVADRVGPAVVLVGRSGRGNGFVIAEGRVATNAHNLRDRTTQVAFSDGRTVQATVTGVDADSDLAVLEADTGEVTPASWSEAGPVSPGTAVFAVANPAGRGLRATFGTVSAVDQAFRGPRGRRITGAFEHTAPLGRGSSGGPVVDAAGRVLGVNTSRLGDGFYLAVPADARVRDTIEALARGEETAGPRLGVGLAPPAVANRLRRAVGLPERDGLLVRAVEAAGAADSAGIQEGDLLVEVDGSPLAGVDDLLDALATLRSGQTLTLRVVRGMEERKLSVSFPDAATGS